MFYDLHIHSDLSPCAEKEMTPNNVINMAKLKELDIIALTDHHSVRNYPAFKMVAGRVGIHLIPGIEITTRENVHLLAYFREYRDAKVVGQLVYESLPDVKNNSKIFGEQNIYNDQDKVVEVVDKLLLNATPFSIDEIIHLVNQHHGIVVPAHVNKLSDGMIGVLGFIPKQYPFEFVEVYQKTIPVGLPDHFKIMYNSDAHRLVEINDPQYAFPCRDLFAFLAYLGI